MNMMCYNVMNLVYQVRLDENGVHHPSTWTIEVYPVPNLAHAIHAKYVWLQKQYTVFITQIKFKIYIYSWTFNTNSSHEYVVR